MSLSQHTSLRVFWHFIIITVGISLLKIVGFMWNEHYVILNIKILWVHFTFEKHFTLRDFLGTLFYWAGHENVFEVHFKMYIYPLNTNCSPCSLSLTVGMSEHSTFNLKIRFSDKTNLSTLIYGQIDKLLPYFILRTK